MCLIKKGLPWKERNGEGESRDGRPWVSWVEGLWGSLSPREGWMHSGGKKKPCLLWDYSQDKALCVCADIVSKVRGKKITFKWEEQKEPPKKTRDGSFFFSSKKRRRERKKTERCRPQCEKALSLTGTFQHGALCTKKRLLEPLQVDFNWLNAASWTIRDSIKTRFQEASVTLNTQ